MLPALSLGTREDQVGLVPYDDGADDDCEED
jgi:hypothetical protein